MARVGFDPTVVNDVAATFVLGQVLDYGGKLYRYGQYIDSAAIGPAANGAVMTFATGTGYTFTGDRAGGTSIGTNYCAGVAVGPITALYFGFLQVAGPHLSVLQAAGGVAVDKQVVVHTVTDFNAGSPPGTVADVPFGYCIVASAGGVIGVQIRGIV